MLDSPAGRNWKSWTSAYCGFFYWYKGDIHHCVIDTNNDIDMSVLNKTDDENFSNFVERTASGISWPELIINASFGENHGLGHLTQTVMGDVISEGKRLFLYQTRERRAYLYFKKNPAEGDRYEMGLGAAPTYADAAIGGLCPLVIGGTKYDSSSSNLYASIAGRSRSTGKVAAGLLPGGFLYVGVQPDSEGSLSVDDARDRLADAGCADAVMLDGSDSAMMYFNGEWKARQGWGKNRVTRVGLCFQ